jgi:hypothetical protein
VSRRTDGELIRLRTTELSWRRIDGEIVVLDGVGSVYYALNETGAALWDMLEDGATRADLVSALCEGRSLSPAQSGSDVDAFLASLREQGLLAE